VLHETASEREQSERKESEAKAVIVGPILGFRGSEGGTWRTCALVVTARDDAPPELSWSLEEGDHAGEVRAAPNPTRLKSFEECEVWRFDWSVEQEDSERTIAYALGDGPEYSYSVPPRGGPPRIAYASCAGFSSLKEMKTVEDKNAMWKVLATQHRARPFHLLIAGGDQVYADPVWDVVRPLSRWLNEVFDVFDDWGRADFTEEIRAAVEGFYFDLYCQRWEQPELAEVMSRVPSLMMWDDHEIFDGWGSYPREQQESAIFAGIFEQAREHFRLFQLQAAGGETLPATLPGQDGFSYAYRVGEVGIAVLDMRSERTQQRVMSLEAWNALYEWMQEKLEGCKHLLIVSSIPVVYVNANLIETAFGMVPSRQDLEDDFKDQWLSRTHLEERLRLVHRLLAFAREKSCRVSIVSGDVHVAALGYVQSARNGFAHEEENVINQLISSGIVHPPPPGLVVYAMEKLMGEVVEEVDRGITARMMKFPFSNQHFLPARNWLSLDPDEQHRVWAQWYVEGESEPYTKVIHPISAPTPR
jgi:hypothetical protein